MSNNPEAIEALTKWRDAQAAAEISSGSKAFMGKPDAWFEDPHWFCINGHVSGINLRCDEGPRCLACHEPVILGPKIGEKAFASIAAHLQGQHA